MSLHQHTKKKEPEKNLRVDLPLFIFQPGTPRAVQRLLWLVALFLCLGCLSGCTGKFEEYNTNQVGFTEEQKAYDYNTFGIWMKVIQAGIYFNYDWGGGKNWNFQTMQNLSADMFAGYMHDYKPFNAGLGKPSSRL